MVQRNSSDSDGGVFIHFLDAKGNGFTVAHGKLVNGQILLGNPDVSCGLVYDGAGRAVHRRF